MANDSKEEITIDNFDLEIDDDDFLEITSITKEEFHKLRDGFDYEEDGERKTFQGMFNKYRFNASIAEFRQRKEQMADYFTAEEDIFELIPNQKTNQIFTPKKVVQMMIDNLEEHDPGLFTRTDSTFIDLYMKSGMYITEVVKKLFHNTRKYYNSDEACLKHILENQVFGLAPTSILQGITQTYIFGFDTEHKISRKNFVQHDLTPEAKEDTAKEKLQELFNLKIDMKFDAVVGNPPYQETTENTSDAAIYPFFYDLAEQIAIKYCLISPARFLFNAGKTPVAWNRKMLENEHLKVLSYEQKSEKLFRNTDIMGGVIILYHDTNTKFEKIGTFTAFKELNSITRKVEEYNTFKSIVPIIHLQQKFNLNRLFEKYPSIREKIGSGGSERRLTTSIFNLDEIFTDNKVFEDSIRILGLIKNQRVHKYLERIFLEEHANLGKFKVIIPKSNGSGAIGEVSSTPLVGEPLVGEPFVGHTQSFISFGAFDKELEAQNCMKYLKSKFSRTMLGVLKVTQDNNPDTWAKVPLQDFTPNSDIDWSQSISEIDRQLYKKYGLSEEEIDFIEEKVQPME
ncbi:MAG: hypothetical protein GX102_03620 [Porphyromonadaceae bacterium]|nr:hypothetical protein [Porphyromonadaceae bacterium]